MQIKDTGLRNAVWSLEQEVRKKKAKKNWQPPQRQQDASKASQQLAFEYLNLARSRNGDPED